MTTDFARTTTEVKQRSGRFASLRAAQRALADLAHPAELEETIDQGRVILIELQALRIQASRERAGSAPDEQESALREGVQRVDRLLDDLLARTSAMMDQMPISQLRAHLRERAAEHADEIRGLIDVLLAGDVECDKNLRLLEYLVTLLSSEECDTGRVVVREPAEVAPQVLAFAERCFDALDSECTAAAQAISDATERLFDAKAIGATRDHIRQYKRELGTRILHPRVLSAAVRYNVGMSNRVAGLVEGGRTIDRMAHDLMDAPETADAPGPTVSIFDSTGFLRIASALQSRLQGETSTDATAMAVVTGFELGGLDPVAVEAFDTRGEDHTSFLVRAAVALGLMIRHEPRIGSELRQLEVDPGLAAGDWLHELAREMTATARKLTAEARYTEASQLSEVTVKHLAVASTSPEHRGGRTRLRAIETPQQAAPVASVRLDATWLRTGGLAFGLLAFALLLAPLGVDTQAPATGDFAELSPYLESGHHSDAGGSVRFIGTLSPHWDRLDTSGRLSVASQIGDGLREAGVDRVVLLDRHDTVQVRYGDGKVLRVEPTNGAR